MATNFEIDDSFISEQNQKTKDWVEEDYEHLSKKLRRQDVDIEVLVAKAEAFRVAIPSALPNIFVGLFMGLGASFLTLIAAETLGVKYGVGWYIAWAKGNAEYAKVYAALVIVSAFCSTIMTLLFKMRADDGGEQFCIRQKTIMPMRRDKLSVSRINASRACALG